MEAGDRAGPDDLTHLDALARDPGRVHLFHALRVIEAAFPDNPRLGESSRPREDMVRLGQIPDMAFPATTISDFKPPAGGRPGQLNNRFFGLFGPNGPLPLHLTEFARDRMRNERDHTFVALANMLTHRLLGLLYRAWSSAEPVVGFDREGADHFSKKIASISGHHGDDLMIRDGMPDLSKRHFAGHLALGSRPAEGLMSIVSGFFDAPVHLQDFIGTWLQLEGDDQWALGAPGGLGQTTSIGTAVYTRMAKFRLYIGPLDLKTYKRLLPGSPSLARLDALVRNYTGDALDYDVNLILKGSEVPKASIGDSMLGSVGWIGDRDPSEDAADLFVIPQTTRPSEVPDDLEGLET